VRAAVFIATAILLLPEAEGRAADSVTTQTAAGGGPRSEVKVDGTDVSKLSSIEDASLEGLLDLNLEDKLGKTDAVSRTNESVLRAPATMTTLDATQIRLSGASTVPDVLRAVPGVAVMRNAPGNYVVSLRGTGGLASNNVILLIDGIPINNPLDGTVSWDLVPVHVDDIERIEVVRGPVSPVYGANAYTGVINIVTRTSAEHVSSYAARVRGGGDPDGGGVGSVSGRYLHIGKRLELKWFGNLDHDGTAARPATASSVAHDGKPVADQASTTGTLTLRTGQAAAVSLELGGVWSRRSSMDHLALDSERLSQTLLFGRLAYEHGSFTPLKLNLRVWAQGVSVAINSERSAQTGFSYDGAKSFRGTTGTDIMVPLVHTLSLQLGGQGSLERIEAPFINPAANGAWRPAYGFYAGLKAAPLPSLDLILTGRGDLAPISAKVEYSYRASAIYHRETWGVRLTAASAFRTPTYVEAVGRFVDPASGLILLEGTDSIGAPRNTSLELGAFFSPHSRLTIAPTVYVSRLSNLMVEDFESVVRRTFRNSLNPRTFVGGEIEANWRVADNLSVLPTFGILEWINSPHEIDTNVAVPSQNSRYMGGLRLQGIFGNDRWGYGIGGTVASPRSFNVRTGIPPVVLVRSIPTTLQINGVLDHQVFRARPFWLSLRLNANLPGNTAESPLPLAAPLGHSAILGISVRRE
jgi:iron complex outermembrane receptor protein